MEEVTNYFDAWIVPLTADVLACRLFSLQYWKRAWSRDWLTAVPRWDQRWVSSSAVLFLAARQLSSTFDVRPISHFFNPGYLWASTITEETILKLLSLLRSLQDAGKLGRSSGSVFAHCCGVCPQRAGVRLVSSTVICPSRGVECPWKLFDCLERGHVAAGWETVSYWYHLDGERLFNQQGHRNCSERGIER